MLSFGLLGPVAVRASGRLVPVPAAKQRTLLATLLVEANKLVPVDCVIEELWGSAPPRSALANLRTYAAALRARLGEPDGACRLHANRQGYTLEIDLERASIDVPLFEAGVLAGRRGLTERDPVASVQRLSAALTLWRGNAFEDAPRGPLLAARAAALEEQRLTAVEDLAQARLDLGEHLTVVAPLRALLSEQPFRERAWALLMTALYRTGDVDAALTAYTQARGQLVDELGVEPGKQLRSTHQAVLRRDPGLDLATSSPPRASRSTTPSQLPADIGAEFTGREALVEELITALTADRPAGGPAAAVVSGPAGAVVSGPAAVVVSGAGGAGKTALAVRVAHRVRAAFPDGQLFIDLGAGHNPAAPHEVLARFLVALGVDMSHVPAAPDERAALFRSTVADRRILIVLDNASAAAQIRPLWPAGTGCAVLVTSRRRFGSLAGVRFVDVDMLSEDESVAMFERLVGADRARAELSAVQRVCRYCGGLPLALRVAAGRLVSRPHWPVRRLADLLAEERQRLDELAVDDLEVRASIELSYRELPPSAAAALQALGPLPVADVPAWAAAVVLERSPAESASVLDSIVDARLLDVSVAARPGGEERYRLHDLVRLFAKAQTEGSEAARTAVERGASAWLALAERAAGRLPTGYAILGHSSVTRPPIDPAAERRALADPVAWFDRERIAVRELVLAAADLDLHELAWDLAVTTMPYYNLRWHGEDWRRTHDAALTAVRRAANPLGEAHLLRNLGELAANDTEYAPAARLLRAAADQFDGLAEPRARAHALLGLGNVQRLGGRPQEALSSYLEARELAGTVTDAFLGADLSHNIAVVHLQRGEARTAAAGFTRAHGVFDAISDKGGAARALRGLAMAHQRLGDVGRAITLLHEAVNVIAGTGDLRALGMALANLAQVCVDAGRLAEAGMAMTRCLPIYDEVDDLFGHAWALRTSAELSLALGDARRAVRLADNAVAMFEHRGIKLEQAKSLETVARADDALGEHQAAAVARQAAGRIYAELGVAKPVTLITTTGRTVPVPRAVR